MASRTPFEGANQGDVAFLETGGVAYRCYVWQRNGPVLEGDDHPYRGLRIEGAVYVEQAHGQPVELWRGIIRTPASGEYVDCPRVVSLGTAFHVHWIEYDPTENVWDEGYVASGRDLHRSTFNVEDDPYAWNHRSSIATSYLHLYDTQSMGPGRDYVLVHAGTDASVTMMRVNGDSWIDQQWTTTQADTLDENILGAVHDWRYPIAVYQSAGRLRAFSCDWDAGTVQAGPSNIHSDIGEFTAVGGCPDRPINGGAGSFIAAEFEDTSMSSLHPSLPATVHLQVDSSTLALPTSHITRNTTLQSKPWRYSSPERLNGDRPQFFATLGFINDVTDEEWLQANHYVVRYEREASDYTGRPIPVANLSIGLANASRHGAAPTQTVGSGSGITPTGAPPYQRRNHIPSASPAPSFGPRMKSYTTFLGRWTRIDSSAAVAGHALRSTTFHHDDPWAYPYDETDPALPSEPYASVSVPQMESAPAANGTVFSGGTPQFYDGHTFTEVGFPWAPEILSVTEESVGSRPNGTYSYVVVAEWRDVRGQTHRSVSTPATVVNASGGWHRVVVRNVTLSMKDNEALGDDTAGPIKLDLYRTEEDGAIFYPIFRGNDDTDYDLARMPVNDPTSALQQIQEGNNNAITDRAPLPYSYASGSWAPLPPSPPPALGAIARWQNRTFGVSAEDPAVLYYTHEYTPEFGGERYAAPEFSPYLTFRIDGVGRVVAMQEMDSSLILFTRDAIYSLHGLAADATGAGSTLQVQLLQRGTGCVEPRSVAAAHDGIYFQARRGFYKLTRQNSLEYVGADVEDELRAAGNIRRVTVHEDSHQVRLLCNGGAYDSPQVLVYDWLMGLWAVWPLPEASLTNGLSSAVDALVWRGYDGEHSHVVLQGAGVLLQKSSTSATRYADESGTTDTVAIPVDVRTGWIHLAGLAGFKRVRKLFLHLTKPAAAGFTVEIEYSLDGSMVDGDNLQTETVSALTTRVEIRTAIQKANSIRIRIYEGTDTPTGDQLTSRTINLHAITLMVGRKPGFARVSPTTQRT